MVCDKTSRCINDLDPAFQPMVRELLDKSAYLNSFITDGCRSWARQAWLYIRQKTKAKPGYSYHNYGLAVDIAFKENGKLNYDAWRYDLLFKIAEEVGIESLYLKYGFDKPHFQYPNTTINIIRANQGLPLMDKTMTEEQVKRVWTAVVHSLPTDKEIKQWKNRDANDLITDLLEKEVWKEQNFLVKDYLRDKLNANL